MHSLEQLRQAEESFRRAAASALEVTIGDHIRGDYGWGDANHLFHRAVLEAAEMPILLRTIEDLHRVVPRNLTWSAIRNRRVLEDNVHQHETIRAAMEAGDGPGARAAMHEHIKCSGALIADWFERQTESSRGGAPSRLALLPHPQGQATRRP